MTSAAIVNKVWNFCHTLRDDGCAGAVQDDRGGSEQVILMTCGH
jgi:hypothetical protein